jgi:hypothetical protein
MYRCGWLPGWISSMEKRVPPTGGAIGFESLHPARGVSHFAVLPDDCATGGVVAGDDSAYFIFILADRYRAIVDAVLASSRTNPQGDSHDYSNRAL